MTQVLDILKYRYYNIDVPKGASIILSAAYTKNRLEAVSGGGRRDEMTIYEASERYQIPIELLREYESWGLCGAVKKVMGDWQYDDQDLERFSMIMTLHDIGFSNEEVETYMRLLIAGEDTKDKRLHMLNKKRDSALDEIHFREKQLERMDYLRYQIRQSKKETIGKE